VQENNTTCPMIPIRFQKIRSHLLNERCLLPKQYIVVIICFSRLQISNFAHNFYEKMSTPYFARSSERLSRKSRDAFSNSSAFMRKS
jgi:hypothetical protein